MGDAFFAAKNILIVEGLVKEYPLEAWREPTMETLEQFMSATDETQLTRAKVLGELIKRGEAVDLQLFLVACVVLLMRAGYAQEESDVKPNNGNKFDEAIKKMISEEGSGRPDELPPDGSEEKLASLQQRSQEILQYTLFKI